VEPDPKSVVTRRSTQIRREIMSYWEESGGRMSYREESGGIMSYCEESGGRMFY